MLCDIFISFYLLLYKHKSTFKDLLNHFPLCVALTTRIHELADYCAAESGNCTISFGRMTNVH